MAYTNVATADGVTGASFGSGSSGPGTSDQATIRANGEALAEFVTAFWTDYRATPVARARLTGGASAASASESAARAC